MSLSHDCYREENSAKTAMILTACLLLLAASVGGQVVVEDGTLVVELSSFLPLENCTETLLQLEVRHFLFSIDSDWSLICNEKLVFCVLQGSVAWNGFLA
jgi:hypothetical protein